MTTLVLEHLQHADSASPDITIDSSGRVGIGTTSPGSQLTVQGTLGDGSSEAYIDGWSIIGNRYQGNTMTKLNWAGGGARIQGFNSGVQKFEISANSSTYFIGGNVGIGTSNPDSILHIKASDSGYTGGIQIEDNDSTTKSAITHVNGALYMSSNTTQDHLTILANGNVGINTGTPQAILDIKGNTTTYGGMSKIYLTDVSNHAESKNWAIGNGGSGFGHFTIGLSNAKDGDPMENGTHTTPLIIDETGKVALYSTTISNDEGFWAANIAEAQDSRMAFRIQPTRGSVNKGISIGAIGKNSSNSTGIQAYDTSNNTANTLELNPHGGAVTTPNQPSFSAHKTSHLSLSGAGQVEGGSWSTTYINGGHNTGGHFNTTTGRFTVPVAGRYKFDANIMHGITSGDFQIWLCVNGNTSTCVKSNSMQSTGGSWKQTTVTGIFNLAANDYISIFVRSSLAEPYAMYGSTTGAFTTCNGYLIG